MMISGWGNYPRASSRIVAAHRPVDVARLVQQEPFVVARGAGRAYGDAAIGSHATLFTSGLNCMIDLDPRRGVLTVEAGVPLGDIVRALVPRGWFPPVVPGTQHVTVGGMVATNVHGKNHHGVGGFGRFVERMTVIVADGRRISCSPTLEPDLFRATVGGMGLTGVIEEVTFRLLPIESAYVREEKIRAADLDDALSALESSQGWTYSVAWIDCLARGASLGRSVLFRGEHALREEAKGHPQPATSPARQYRVPFACPPQVLNRWSMSAFNALYYSVNTPGTRLVPLQKFFFPLDSISDWNRIYGRRGFVQHQSVIPKRSGRDALGQMLELMSGQGNPSFLAVLKLLGDDDAGMLAFPREGYTLTLDLPADAAALSLLERLDMIVQVYGGRIYLAKDARQSRELLEAGYPQLEAFREFRRTSGAAGKFRSRQSERLAL
jgi:decaprenylphospho-beta-D-ribofuranose 2-oxidase